MKTQITEILFQLNASLDEFENVHLYDVLKDYSVTQMHCIDYIAKIQNANVTKISNAMNITKGGVSKIIKKLLQKGAIETYSFETNKKEVYYKLTPLGEEVFNKHKTIHKKWCTLDDEFFSKFSDEDLKITANILLKYNEELKRRQDYE